MPPTDFERVLDRLILEADTARRYARSPDKVGHVLEKLAEALEEFAKELKKQERIRSRSQRQS
jgi:hypothetical protein